MTVPTRTMPDLHPCPVEACGRKLVERQIMCPDHWRDVPEHLQKRVRLHKKDPDASAYAVAVRDAILSVRGRTTS